MKLHIENGILMGLQNEIIYSGREELFVDLVIPDTVRAIADDAFSGWRELYSVVIPGSVKRSANAPLYIVGIWRKLLFARALK